MPAEKRTDTWMPLYVADYLSDTMHLTTEQHGAYFLLLMACWKRDGKLPNDNDELAAITRLTPAKWRAYRHALLRFFLVGDDVLTHKRVLKERAKAKETSAARAESGKRGAAKRWQVDGKCHSRAIANASQNDRPSPSPLPVTASVANATGADAPPDPLWGTGLAWLKRKGIPEKQARALLGKIKQAAGDIDAAAILARAEAEDITNPSAWLMAAAAKVKQSKPSASTDFRGKSYAGTPIDQLPADLRAAAERAILDD